MSGGYSSLGSSHSSGARVVAWVFGFLATAGILGAVDGVPTFTRQPSSQATFVGNNILLSAETVSEWPASYQWLVDGKPIAERTEKTLRLFCVSLNQSGKEYRVVASNIFGAVTSAPAVLRVTVPEFGRKLYTWGIDYGARNQSFNPANHRDQVGEIVNVDLLDTSIGAIWGTGIYTDDSSVSAAAVHAGILPQGQRATVGLLLMGPQNSFPGSDRNGIVSQSFNMSWPGSFQFVDVVPTITRQPKPQVRMVGGSVSFSVEAVGQGTLSYQWQHNGAFLPGETNATLTVAIASEAQAGSYAVKVTDKNGSNTSDYAILGVLPYVATRPKARIISMAGVPDGDIRHLALTGNTNGGSVWGKGIYTIDSDLERAAVHDGWLNHGETGVLGVVCLPEQPEFLADADNDVTTVRYGRFPAVAFTGLVPTVTKDPVSQALYEGKYCALRVEAQHKEPVTIQWRRNGVPIPGATLNEFHAPSAQAGSAIVYDAVVSSPGNPVPTESAFIFTLSNSTPVVQASNPAEIGSILADGGSVVYSTLTGATNSTWFWGTGVYTTDSELGAAAVHADRLALGQSGEVGMYGVGFWPGFYGSTRNGLSSATYIGMAGYVFLFPPAVPAPKLRQNVAGQLVIEGSAGQTCQIWSTASLNSPQWTHLSTVTLNGSQQTWTDTQASGQKTRFYRVVVVP